MENYFGRLNAINVNDHVEKKGQFAYLSWPFAVAQLRLADPSATWEIRRFDGLPFCRTEVGYFVEVAVTVQGITLSQLHPVLDAKNRPIAEPSSFDINTSIQRCLVKAIALHGLGLYIYAGEDLPEAERSDEARKPEPPRTSGSEPGNVASLPNAAPASKAQLRYIEQLLDRTGQDRQRLLDYFHITDLSELTMAGANRAIKSLEKHRRAA